MMKNNQQLLKEAKILETKLAQIKKQISLNEVKRMQQIAGVKPSKRFLKENFEEGKIKVKLNPNSDNDYTIYDAINPPFNVGSFDMIKPGLVAYNSPGLENGSEDINNYVDYLNSNNIDYNITDFYGYESVEIPISYLEIDGEDSNNSFDIWRKMGKGFNVEGDDYSTPYGFIFNKNNNTLETVVETDEYSEDAEEAKDLILTDLKSLQNKLKMFSTLKIKIQERGTHFKITIN